MNLVQIFIVYSLTFITEFCIVLNLLPKAIVSTLRVIRLREGTTSRYLKPFWALRKASASKAEPDKSEQSRFTVLEGKLIKQFHRLKILNLISFHPNIPSDVSHSTKMSPLCAGFYTDVFFHINASRESKLPSQD